MKIVALEYLVDIQVAQGFIIYAQFLGNDVVMDDIMYEACSIDITQSGTTNQIKLVNIVVLYSIGLVGLVECVEKSETFRKSHPDEVDSVIDPGSSRQTNNLYE